MDEYPTFVLLTVGWFSRTDFLGFILFSLPFGRTRLILVLGGLYPGTQQGNVVTPFSVSSERAPMVTTIHRLFYKFDYPDYSSGRGERVGNMTEEDT